MLKTKKNETNNENEREESTANESYSLFKNEILHKKNIMRKYIYIYLY